MFVWVDVSELVVIIVCFFTREICGFSSRVLLVLVFWVVVACRESQ
jgi:hypothetical protein